MRVKHITTKTTVDDGAKIEKDNIEYGKTALRSYRIRIQVRNAQEEIDEYRLFTTEIAKLQEDKRLTIDKDDPSTRPAFIIHYPSYHYKKGPYFIIKTYTVFVDI